MSFRNLLRKSKKVVDVSEDALAGAPAEEPRAPQYTVVTLAVIGCGSRGEVCSSSSGIGAILTPISLIHNMRFDTQTA